MTNPLYWLVTITDRRSTDAFLALYESYGVRVSLRTVGAGGGTVLHAKGTGMEGAARFLGVDLVNEKEMVFIVARSSEKNKIMKAIMAGADPKAGAIVFSLPVTDTAGLRLLDEDETEAV